MQLFRRFFRFYNEINVYGTTSGRSNDDYKCFIDYYKAIDFPSFCRIQKKYAPKTAHNTFFLILYLVEKQQKTLFTNIYFSPLSSKPLALGIALFYIWEQGHHQAMSIIYPQCKNYITENSEGIGCIWRYEFQLPPYK